MSVKLTEQKVNEIKKNLSKTIPSFFGNQLKETKLNEFVAKTLGYKNWNTLQGVIKPDRIKEDMILLVQLRDEGMGADYALVELSSETLNYIQSQALEMEDEYRSFDIDDLYILDKHKNPFDKYKSKIKKMDNGDISFVKIKEEDIDYDVLMEDNFYKVDYPEVRVSKNKDNLSLYFSADCRYSGETYESLVSVNFKDILK